MDFYKKNLNEFNNKNKYEYLNLIFLESLLCCNNIEKYDMNIFGNNIEIELFNNMKWDLKKYEVNNNIIKNVKTLKENKHLKNNKFNNQYYYIIKNIYDIFP